MAALRRILLTALPKLALSRTTGLLTDIPVPRRLRAHYYRWFAARYGARLDEVELRLEDYRSLGEFFQRGLKPGARPIDPVAPLVWPADGRIVSSGPIDGDRIPQVKGRDYALVDLVVDGGLAARLHGGSQATIYLAPGDYHRVHAPFDGQRVRHWHIPGKLFPVNAPAVRSIDQLFVQNERMVFECRLADGRAGVVVMVAALNVGNISVSFPTAGEVARGAEIGRFGFGSTVVAIVENGGPSFARLPPETVVRVGGAAI